MTERLWSLHLIAYIIIDHEKISITTLQTFWSISGYPGIYFQYNYYLNSYTMQCFLTFLILV